MMELPADEESRFRLLLDAFLLPADAYVLHEECFVPDFGPTVQIICISGPICGRYSRADGEWLDRLERDLRVGLYAFQSGSP